MRPYLLACNLHRTTSMQAGQPCLTKTVLILWLHLYVRVSTAQVAVFGFCDIRRFTDTTEVLQEGVMEFVNVIAHLVHTAVAARGGAANKNIGDAFLLVRVAGVGARLPLSDLGPKACGLCMRGILLLRCEASHGCSRSARCNANKLLALCDCAASPRCGSCPRVLTTETSVCSAVGAHHTRPAAPSATWGHLHQHAPW
jgi:class 3 adenylate cyclase